MRFFDEVTGFHMNMDGFQHATTADLEREETKLLAAKAFSAVESIESGSVVNHTEYKAESEDRAVDHYNLRLKEERVPGKSLAHSITQWNEVKAAVDAILDGKTVTPKGETYTDVIFNGLGGSFLGPLMLIISQHGEGFNFASGLPIRIHFVCNTDPDSFMALLAKLDASRTIMVSMSKSGSTAETKGATDGWMAHLKAAGLPIGPHSMAVTTRGSMLDKMAASENFLGTFHMFTETGGRTSIGSAIGMVPAAFARVDFAAFLEGQSCMDDLTRRKELAANPAFMLAYGMEKMTLARGSKNMIVLSYSDALKEYAHYLQQLYMESLGKNYHVDGTPAVEGQTVFGGVGTGEQHAFMQQVQKGLNDCFVRFIHFAKRKGDLPNAKAGTVGRQLLAFVKGTEAALHQNGRDFVTMTYSECSPFNIGMMVALEERVVTFLAAFKNINAYDQPGVQDGKLAADAMNTFSKEAEAHVAKNGHTGPVTALLAGMGRPNTFETRLMADAFLTDVAMNPSSYAIEGKVERRWTGEEFEYTM